MGTPEQGTRDQLQGVYHEHKTKKEIWLACGDLADATYVYCDRPDGEPADQQARGVLDRHHEGDPTLIDGKLRALGYTRIASIFTRCGDRVDSPYAFAGFVAKPLKGKCKIYFSWRGTVLPDEWLEDAEVDLEDFEVRGRDSTLQLDGRAHKGFFLLHKSARYQKVGEPGRLTREEFLDKLKPEYGAQQGMEVLVTGHSLGGALATLNAYQLSLDLNKWQSKPTVNLVTFSAPRSLSFTLAHKVDRKLRNHVRIVTDGDIVPLMPLYTGRSADPEPIDDTEGEGPMIMAQTRMRLPSRETIAQAIHGVLDKARWADLINRRLKEVCISMKSGGPAKYHHAGTCVYLTTTALERDLYKSDRFKWELHVHHSLKLILHLLDPTSATRLKALKEELKVVAPSDNQAPAPMAAGAFNETGGASSSGHGAAEDMPETSS